MMKLWKKWMGILCIFVMCLNCLTSCGENEAEAPSVTEGSEDSEETTPSTPNRTEDSESETTGLKGLALKEELRWQAVCEFHDRVEEAKKVTLDFSNPDSYVKKETDSNGITRFTIQTTECGALNFEAQGVSFDESGALVMSQGSALTLLTEIPGLMQANIEANLASPDGENNFGAREGLSPSKRSEIHSSKELIYTTGAYAGVNHEGATFTVDLFMETGYVSLISDCECSVTQVVFSYSGESRGICELIFDTTFYGMYAEGDYYNPSLEHWSREDGIFSFYLEAVPDTKLGTFRMGENLYYVEDAFEVGDLHAKDGAVKAKTEPLAIGDYLDVTIIDTSYQVALPIYPEYHPESLHDGSPAAVTNGIGDLNVLVIPVYFEDQEERLPKDRETLLNVLGNAVLADGQTENREAVGDYFTFSDYFAKASYGKLNITSYVTDWYCVPDYTFAERKTGLLYEEESEALEKWLKKNYASWNDILDQDNDGLYDAVVMVVASDGRTEDDFYQISLGGAVHLASSYGYACVKEGQKVYNHNVLINVNALYETIADDNSGISSRTLLHEFGHGLGLIDYYDVSYSGINALGNYDMQSNNSGDWNPASKYAVGWVTPTVLTKEQLAQGGTFTISSLESSGDVLLLPISGEVNADGSYNPFNEYLLIDLFTPDGLHQYDAADTGLTNAGVRIYHVDARLLELDLMKDWYEEGTTYEMACFNSYNGEGRYFVQLLQAGGRNTFTNPDFYEEISDRDLFHAGDSFSLGKYAAVFPNGFTHNKTDFPYTITVTSIENGTATIEIK